MYKAYKAYKAYNAAPLTLDSTRARAYNQPIKKKSHHNKKQAFFIRKKRQTEPDGHGQKKSESERMFSFYRLKTLNKNQWSVIIMKDNERLNNVRRLAYGLYCADEQAVKRLAVILHYSPEQLQKDIAALEEYTREKVSEDRSERTRDSENE